MTPLTPLAPHHRIAWLDGHKSIRCKKSLDGFDAGRLYRLSTKTLKIKSLMIRLCEGKKEDVLVTGNEFFVIITDNARRKIMFSDHVSKKSDRIVHDTLTLSEHFEIPDVPDVSKVYPNQFSKLTQLLSSI